MPYTRKRNPLKRRFWDKVSLPDENGCMEWRGARRVRVVAGVNYDYGFFHRPQGYEGQYPGMIRAHRISYELHNGPIPEGLVVRHSCDNFPCVAPGHLELGTVADNQRDMKDRDRRKLWERTGRCANGHDVSSPDRYKVIKRTTRDDERVCLSCHEERQTRYYGN